MEQEYDPRYAVEQYLLPHELYTSGPLLLTKMLGDANAVMRLFYSKAGEDSVQDDFSEMHRVYYREESDASILVIRIEMPTPELPLRSRAVYLCYCDRNGENLYFTSELAATGQYFLCCRPDSEKIMHMLCCDAPEDVGAEFDAVAERYWGLIFDNGLKQLESLCTR